MTLAERPTRRRAGQLAWLMLAVAWLGGLTFYAAVVVPIGAQVTSSTIQGFITQRVTFWLNSLGTAYLAATSRDLGGRGGRLRQVAWWLMAVAQACLWLLHPQLDRWLDPTYQEVLDTERFYAWHRAYLLATTLQWIAGVFHVGAVGGDGVGGDSSRSSRE